jgi:hypothetical protein
LLELKVAAAAQDILQRTSTETEFRRRLDLVETILVNNFPQMSMDLSRGVSSQTTRGES